MKEKERVGQSELIFTSSNMTLEEARSAYHAAQKAYQGAEAENCKAAELADEMQKRVSAAIKRMEAAEKTYRRLQREAGASEDAIRWDCVNRLVSLARGAA